jgi:hypothetical protein
VVFRGLKADHQIIDLGGLSCRVIDLKAGVDGDDGAATFLNVEKAVFKDQGWVIVPQGNTDPVAGNASFSTRAGQALTGWQHQACWATRRTRTATASPSPRPATR